MGLRKKSKVSAQFNLSSMTDIIFLLLIFFMLTSSLVSPNALFLKLPGRGNPSVSSERPPDISISRRGVYRLDGNKIEFRNLPTAIRRLKRSSRGKLDITISPANNTPVEHVVAIMDLAVQANVSAILATPE